MAQVQKSVTPEIHGKEEELKGTFVSVLILGGILAVCWATVFIIFLVRNGG